MLKHLRNAEIEYIYFELYPTANYFKAKKCEEFLNYDQWRIKEKWIIREMTLTMNVVTPATQILVPIPSTINCSEAT